MSIFMRQLLIYALLFVCSFHPTGKAVAYRGGDDNGRTYFDQDTKIIALPESVIFVSNGYVRKVSSSSNLTSNIAPGNILSLNNNEIYIISKNRISVFDSSLKPKSGIETISFDEIEDIKFSDDSFIVQRYSGSCMYLEAYSIVTKKMTWSSKNLYCAPYTIGDAFSYFANQGKVYGVGKYGASYLDSYSGLIDLKSGKLIDIYSLQLGIESKNPITHKFSENFLSNLQETPPQNAFILNIHCKILVKTKGSQEINMFFCPKYNLEVTYIAAGIEGSHNSIQYFTIRSKK